MGFISLNQCRFNHRLKLKNYEPSCFLLDPFLVLVLLSMHVAFVDAEWYLVAIFELGKVLLSMGEANGTLQLAVKTAIGTSASVLHQMLLG